jgi:tetratricopeptide (TPR) repeat protein
MQLRRKVPALLFTLALIFASYWALRLAYADYLFRSGRPENIRRAAQLAPFNADYQARSGNLMRAIELNPFFAAAWLDLAAEAEARGNPAEAERCLNRASEVDKTYEPRWALANFYFRAGNVPLFWKWLRLAAERSYGDRTALFRLGLRMSADAAEIQNRALPANDRAILLDWLTYLLSEKRLDSVPVAALALIPVSGPADRPALLNACETMLKARRTADAVGIWNGIVGRGMLPHKRIGLVAGDSLTNGDLAAEPLGECFDWRLLWRDGVDSRWLHSSRQVRVGLNGKQMERTDLVEQLIPVLANRQYTFHYRYRTYGFAARSGVRWRVLGASAPQPVELAVDPVPGANDWQDRRLGFRTGAGCNLLRLQLLYEREPGTVRAEGTIVFDGVFQLVPTV